jgi:hypothetical protein
MPAVAPSFPDRVRLPLAFDPAPLAAELAALKTDWTPHYVPRNYEGEWSALPLRAPVGATHPILMIAPPAQEAAFVDTPLLARLPAIAAVLRAFRCPLASARLMRLGPGARIKPHRDDDLDAALGEARIHVPITTNDGISFTLNDETVAMAPGEAWYLRLADTHSAANRGATDRVHLVFDARVNDWLAAQLASGAASAGHLSSVSA